MAERMIVSGEVELWSEDLGDPRDPTLLLIMGANASGVSWPEEFIALLVAGGHHVIRYDHRDTGRSTCRDFTRHPYSLIDLARDAVSVLDGHGVQRAHVVGLSMGGTLGQVLALDHRERLHTLTVMLTAALGVDFVGNMERAFKGQPTLDGLPTPDPRVLAVLARRAEPVRDRASELDRRVTEWRALSGDKIPFDVDEFRRYEERVIAHAGSLVQPSAHALATPVPLARGAELRGITTPTLVIQGGQDPLNPPPHGRHLAQSIPGARLVELPDMGHALPSAIHRPLADAILDHTHRSA
ncbi:alpha/beta fold hydrolase [Archangium violaceum]|uniref:alpha/beta fold hydrolase n=1 Tax=Archangium violaceum TaxID=83451 RepID=UPI00193BE10F|nr:alpha/beta fold hydrolase [Archangium violaceum]QRK04870.1 alpha/beta fold hydrolase [Archangium violaceum]